jgi:hypothetical protein
LQTLDFLTTSALIILLFKRNEAGRWSRSSMQLGVRPGKRTDPGGILIELLPLRIRDHMPDRYCRALQ